MTFYFIHGLLRRISLLPAPDVVEGKRKTIQFLLLYKCVTILLCSEDCNNQRSIYDAVAELSLMIEMAVTAAATAP